jgi:hypothetical protein
MPTRFPITEDVASALETDDTAEFDAQGDD